MAKREPMSKTRKSYFFRLVIRTLILAFFIALFVVRPDFFSVLDGMTFFQRLSPLHALWLLWIIDMVCQLVPVWRQLPVGSGKLFRGRFRPIRDKINYEALRDHIIAATRSAYKVFILWVILLAVLGVLYYTNGTMDYRVNDNGEESIGELVVGNVAELWEPDSFVDYLKGLEDADFLMMNDCFYYVGASEYSSMLPDELCIVIGNGRMRVTFFYGEEFIELLVSVGSI